MSDDPRDPGKNSSQNEEFPPMNAAVAELLTDLDEVSTHLDDRVDVWRVIVDEQGRELHRIYRGSFSHPPSSQEPDAS
jgi:hypothetical protein